MLWFQPQNGFTDDASLAATRSRALVVRQKPDFADETGGAGKISAGRPIISTLTPTKT
jgi:hypothetical protein